MLYDLDGSLAQAYNNVSMTGSTMIYKYFNHIIKKYPNACYTNGSSSSWDSFAICDDSITLRRIYITNPKNSSIYSKTIYVTPIDNEED